MDHSCTDLTWTFPMEEDSLEDLGLDNFEVTLRIHDSVTPDPTDGTENNIDGIGRGDIPHIAVTPMTPPSAASLSPDGHSTVSLNSSNGGGSPMFQQRDIDPLNGGMNHNIWRSESPLPPQSETEAKDFFAYRDSILNHVITEVQESVNIITDGSIRGKWLITEVDSWNHEWERILVLCEKVLIIIKYDFIGMKIEDKRRLELNTIDKVIQGELAYPQNSLTPKLNGLAEGIAGVVKDCILPTVHGTVQTVGCAVWRKNRCTNPTPEQAIEAVEDNDKKCPSSPTAEAGELGTTTRSIKGSIMSALSLEKFESKSRNAQGIQIIWDENQPLSFHQKWNPFDKSIPRLTFTSHPLFWHKGGGGSVTFFDVEPFSRELIYALGQGGGDVSPSCRIEYKPIVIESYVGIASLLHNANSLGFYKVRGKVSF